VTHLVKFPLGSAGSVLAGGFWAHKPFTVEGFSQIPQCNGSSAIGNDRENLRHNRGRAPGKLQLCSLTQLALSGSILSEGRPSNHSSRGRWVGTEEEVGGGGPMKRQ